jgi:hypothetical protein
MEHEDLLLFLQEPATGPYSESGESRLHLQWHSISMQQMCSENFRYFMLIFGRHSHCVYKLSRELQRAYKWLSWEAFLNILKCRAPEKQM